MEVTAIEFFCILGPSGCGKTSTLNTIANLEKPTGGKLTIESPAHQDDINIGMVFQQHGLFPWMTIKDNILFVLKNNVKINAQDIHHIADTYLARVGLSKFASYYPHQLSGGMRQRVSIARSFAINPDLLLMDEPFVFVDYQTRLMLQEMLLELWQGTTITILFVTHDIEEAVALADRILVMTAHPGTVKRFVTIPFARPRNIFELRKQPEFIQYVNDITEMIRAEMLAALHKND